MLSPLFVPHRGLPSLHASSFSVLDPSHCFPSLNVLPLSMLDTLNAGPLNALHLSVLYRSQCLPVSLLLPFLMLFLSRCVTSLNALPLLVLSPFSNALPLSIPYFFLCFTSLDSSPLSLLYHLPLSVVYLFLYFTSFKVIFCMTEVLTNFLWLISLRDALLDHTL